MRFLYPLIATMLLSMWVGAISKACNQKMYDLAYTAIVQNAMKYDVTDREAEYKAMEEKHREIDVLRRLCDDQKSSYEKGEKVK